MALQTIHTLSHDKPFDYKYVDADEVLVYPSDEDGNPQKKYAIAITKFEQELVKDRIKEAGTIVLGASRDNPPEGSLGATLKANGCSPQLLSYFSAILVHEGYSTSKKYRNTLMLSFSKPPTPK